MGQGPRTARDSGHTSRLARFLQKPVRSVLHPADLYVVGGLHSYWFRTAVKLYIEQQANPPGSHIKSKLTGALALSVLPVFVRVRRRAAPTVSRLAAA